MTSARTYTIIKETIKEMKSAGLSNDFIKREITDMFEGDVSKEDVSILLNN
jgi:hypothetical protein